MQMAWHRTGSSQPDKCAQRKEDNKAAASLLTKKQQGSAAAAALRARPRPQPPAPASAHTRTRLWDELAKRVKHEPQQLDVLPFALAAHKHRKAVRVLHTDEKGGRHQRRAWVGVHHSTIFSGCQLLGAQHLSGWPLLYLVCPLRSARTRYCPFYSITAPRSLPRPATSHQQPNSLTCARYCLRSAQPRRTLTLKVQLMRPTFQCITHTSSAHTHTHISRRGQHHGKREISGEVRHRVSRTRYQDPAAARCWGHSQ